MKIVMQLVILTLSLLLVDALDDQYCSNLFWDFKTNCTTSVVKLDNCCHLRSSFLASGVYKISRGLFDSYADTYCDMLTDSGGWIVIQRNNASSSVSFYKKWVDYEKGFGDLNKEFWYGLENIHCLTQRGHWEMRVDYQRSDKTWSHLHYTVFYIGGAREEYPLTVGGFTGVGTNWFAYSSYPHNGMKFSTYDNDNDRNSGNCASSSRSGWWFNNCYRIDINKQPPYHGTDGNVLFTEMKIRPYNCIVS